MTDVASGEISPFDYAAVGDGVADDTAAVVRALDTTRNVNLKGGTFLVTTMLTMEDFQWLYNGTILKGHGGDGIDMTAQQSAFDRLLIECNGTAGRGVIINAIGTNTQRQHMRRTFIQNSIGYPLEFTEDFAGALFTCDDCAFASATPGLEGVKLPTDTVGGFPGRWFYNCHQGGNEFMNISNAKGTRILGGSSTLITMDASSAYTTIKNHRLAFALTLNGSGHIVEGCDVADTLTINGSDHIVGGNVFSGNQLVVGDGTAGCTIRVDDSTFTDNSNPAEPTNRIYGQHKNPVPLWESTGSAPALGNANDIKSRASTEGTLRHFAIEMTLTAGFNIGTGAYKWRMPPPFDYIPTTIDAIGHAMFWDASTGFYHKGIAYMSAGSTEIFVASADGTAAFWDTTTPVVPAIGDFYYIDISFHN